MTNLANSLKENLLTEWERNLTRYATRTAVVGSNHRATYAELATYIDTATITLSLLGVRSGVKVVLFFPNQPHFLVAFLAVIKAGGIPCPLNPSLTAFELDQLLSVLEPQFAIVGDISADVKSYVQRRLPSAELSSWFLQPTHLVIAPIDTPEPELEEVACILCTSGTTGLPKAVMLTHSNLINNVQALWANKRWLEHEVFGNSLPTFHIYGITVLTLLPLSMGGTVVYMPRFSPESCLKTIEQEQITRFGGVPSMFATLNKYRNRQQFDWSSCLSWISGGAPLPGAVVDEFFAKYEGFIYEGYGMLETSPGISWNLDDRPYHKAAVGRPLQGVKVQIRDEQGTELAPEESGEIWVQGPSVMKGYYRNAMATAQTLQHGWLNTGDIGRFDAEGYLYLMGRKKDVMIIGGHNVYPREIETVLLSHETIADAAVATQADITRGEHILAFVVPVAGGSVNEQALLSQCRQTLSAFKVPRRIYTIDQIPRNDSGKILRHQLLQQFSLT